MRKSILRMNVTKKEEKLWRKNWKEKKKKFWNENADEDQIYAQQKASPIGSAKQKKKYQEVEDKVTEQSRPSVNKNKKQKKNKINKHNHDIEELRNRNKWPCQRIHRIR